ncbi:MAG TPA: hypothetical protein VH684_04660 [Xanthobacteraceae bacterium]|jgi:hypothetical protein
MQNEIDFQDVETIKEMVERSLTPAVLARLEKAGVSLTLNSANVAGFQPVVVDQGLADQLAERELLEEMVSYRKDVTGVDHTVFISPKGHTRHGPRIKLAIDPPDSVDPRGKTASVAINDGAVVAGESVGAAVLDQVRRFIDLNRAALLDYWEYRIDTEQLRRRLKPIV